MKLLSALGVVAVVASGSKARAEPALSFFGDTGYFVAHQANNTDEHSSGDWNDAFDASEFDVFITETVGKLGFAAELVFESDNRGAFGVDADRLEVTYRYNDLLHVRAGRIRSALGYYGDAYQNGKFFMLAAAPPTMYEVPRANGVLPTHAIGLHLDGTLAMAGDTGAIRYDAEVLNGRADTVDEIPTFHDHNAAKAVNLRLRYIGAGNLDGLVVGANLYLDQIPHVSDNPNPGQHEVIVAAHAAFIDGAYHFIAEGAVINHHEDIAGTVHRTYAFFGEAGYAVGAVTPFVRYEQTHFASNGDPFYADLAVLGSSREVDAGVKYAASENFAFKLQGSFTRRELADDRTAILVQAAFAF
jgi:hypothetical protein